MQETIGQISNQVTEKWNGLSKKQKIQLGVGVVIVISAIALIGYMMKPQMRTLYKESMEPKFIAKTTAALGNQKITYKIINDGTNIEVDSKQYSSAVMALALEGITDTNYSFEDVMANSMSTTEDEKKQKWNYFTQSEIENTFKQIEGIENARIQLYIPEEKNSFLQAQQESTASVFLTLSKPISVKQAEGMANYLAYGIKNLDKKNIHIMDSTGNTIYLGGEAESFDVSKQQEMKQVAEELIESKLDKLLRGLYDDVRISPNLVLDFNQHQETTKEYSSQGDDPQRGVVKQEASANSSSTNSNAGGEPGTATNGGDAPTYQMDDGTVSESKDSSKEIIYVPNEKESISIKNVGDIDFKASSVAVNVFKNKLYKEEDVTPSLVGISWEGFKSQNKEQKPITIDESIIEAVRSATGIQNVVVNGYENPIFLDKEIYQIDFKDYLPYLFILLVLLLIVVLLIMKFRKHDDVVEVEPELEVEEMLKVAKEQVEIDEIEFKESLETKRQIDKFVDEKPEAVANLLRNWLSEEDWE